ncbi:MAG: endonuclease V [Pleurocapsa minor GSE-CHR-MK-17-07R]|jgi:deoxyribonuclease V|nr:endonuclease V [Pleurocapsa minor GSE-CHR-MK 17-07R]
MQIRALHNWQMTPAEAVQLQVSLASQLIDGPPLTLREGMLVAGVDVSVQPNADGVAWSQAAVVVLAFPSFAIIETVTAQMPTPFPYVPGLLTFREGPVLVQAFEKLVSAPDVFIFDGMGRAHPRRIGIAAHMGLWLDRPTIGCGKTLFVGRHDEPPHERGAWAPLVHRGDLIGAALRTRPHVKSVYISAGHRIDLASSIAVTMACTGKYRLPEPIRAAHNAAGQMG